ncbi:MAG: GntR family transcriptional regulator [Ilumatobacteraceae bacterium]|nr:GntR family transcriptional regulator [Ilumatobacteraceae bacterium]
MIIFHLDVRSGVSTYLQLVQQVRQAMQLGQLTEGDQLPTVKDVAARLAINPNTVLKASRELEHEGLAAGRPGLGTFITRTMVAPSPLEQTKLRRDLGRWVGRAREAGFDDETMLATLRGVLSSSGEQEGVA